MLAHLDLPALTWLCVKATAPFPHFNDIQELVPYVVRHAHGPQDTQPLQSALVLAKGKYIDILAWTMLDIDNDVHDLLTLLSTTLPNRVAHSLTNKGRGWYIHGTGIETACTAIAALPLDSLITLIVKDTMSFGEVSLTKSQKWPLLRRVRLTRYDVHEFLNWLQTDKGGCENLPFP